MAVFAGYPQVVGNAAFCQFLKMGSGDHINDILAGMQHFVCKIFRNKYGVSAFLKSSAPGCSASISAIYSLIFFR